MDKQHGSKKRIDALIEYSQAKTPTEFARMIETSQGEISEIVNNKRQISPFLAYKIHKKYPEIDTIWLVDGQGEMLKFEQLDSFFSNNLRRLMVVHEMSAESMASLIPCTQLHFTRLINGAVPPSLTDLVRIRDGLAITIDDLLFTDLDAVPMNEIKEAKKNNLKMREIEHKKADNAKMNQLETELQDLKKIVNEVIKKSK